MMIHLASPTFDVLGSLYGQITENSKIFDLTRRVSKTATLDGGVSIVDFGFSEGDRVLDFNIRLASTEDFEKLNRMVTLYSQLVACCWSGIFLIHPTSLTMNNDIIILRCFVKYRLTEPRVIVNDPVPPPIG